MRMMKRKLAGALCGLAVAALLAGCATPGELQKSGVRSDYALSLPPERAARCMARNAEEYFSANSAHVTEGEAPGTYKIEVRTEQLVALARIEPFGRHSKATIWRGHFPLIERGLPDAMAKGC